MNSVPPLCIPTSRQHRGSDSSDRRPLSAGRQGLLASPRRPIGLENTFSGLSRSTRGSFYSLSTTPRRIDHDSDDVKNALKVMQKLFLPIVMRKILRQRKRKRWPGKTPPRVYSLESIVDAIRSSHSLISSWPEEALKAIALEAIYFYLQPDEIIVYENERYVSCGIVVLLHGALKEYALGNCSSILSGTAKVRKNTAPNVFCDRVVLCSDASSTFLAANDYADVAVIPARWIWDVISSGVDQLSETGVKILECLRVSIVPMSKKLIMETYYPTPLLLRRSWLWSLMSSSDRAKLARTMHVKVLCMGETLYNEGDVNPFIYIIRRGTITSLIQKEPLTEFDSGTAFGEVSALFNEPRCCTVVASSMCEFYCLHRSQLLRRLRKRPELCRAVIACAMERRQRWLEEAKKRGLMGLSALLSGVPCLSQATDRMRLELAQTATSHAIPPGKTLFKKGELCDQLFIIGRGTVVISKNDMRGTAGYVGELCLLPHLWPVDIVTKTSVDGWSLSAEAIRRALATIRGEAQATNISRQGIDLYRAHHGPDSIIEEIPTEKSTHRMSQTPLSAWAVGAAAPQSPSPSPPQAAAAAAAAADSTTTATTVTVTAAASLSSRATVEKKREGRETTESYDWVSLVLNIDDQPLEDETVKTTNRSEEEREVEHAIERELRRRAADLVSLPRDNIPSAVDCDFPGEVDLVQQMLVEQLLLLKPAHQPRLLQQVNRSRVTLLVEDAAAEAAEELSSGGTTANNLTLPQYVVQPPVVPTLDGISDRVLPTTPDVPMGIVSPRGLLDPRSRSRPSEGALPKWATLQPQPSSPPNRLAEDLAILVPRSRPQSGLSPRSRGVTRPSSAFSFGRTPPRASSASTSQRQLTPSVSLSNRTSNICSHAPSPPSESASGQSNGNSWVKPTSIDLSQQAKVNAAMFQSALDRYVKLDDQSYFQEIVHVGLPLQTEEQWIEEEQNESSQGKNGFILLLMHLRRCVDLDIQNTVKLPIVKVSCGSRVLIRTPVMTERTRPIWTIEVASFISFIRRDSNLFFTICDMEDETQIAYSAVMPTSDFRENGGVGLRIMRLTPEAFGTTVSSADKVARLEVCLMTITASKYSTLQKQLADESDKASSMDDTNTVYLQVLGVQGLKHRIEAAVVVSIESNGDSKEILRTPKITPKTRSPSWPGQSSFCVIQSDGSVSFDLFHRDQFLASYDTPVDTLAFGGTGIRVFPLVRAQGNASEVYAELVVSILGTKTSCYDDEVTDRQPKYLVVHVDSFHMCPSSQDEFIPDPFVILKGPKDEVILRTPLCVGTHEAKWSEEEASCFIMCPFLLESTATYTLEVYDNNERNMIGVAEMTISTNGTSRHRLQYKISGRGVLTVYAHSFTAYEIPRPRRTSDPYKLCPNLASNGLEKDEEGKNPLLLLHISGCDNLQGTGFDDFQIDPLVTVRVGRRRVVIAPMVSGKTSPRWSYPKSTILLPVCQEIINYVILEVWDTNIELCDVLGVARVSIEDLCQTGTHCFPLQPHKDQEFGRKQNLGSIIVKTRFGRVNSEVIKPGSSEFFKLGTSYSATLYESRMFHTQGNAPDLPVTRVRLHVSNCSFITPDVPVKSVKVIVSCLQHVLLEAQKVFKTCMAWSLEEAQTIVDLRAIYGRPIMLTVSCSSRASNSQFADVGAAIVPFSVLVSTMPDGVSVRSFPLRDTAVVGHEISSESSERSRNTSVSTDSPSVTISLLAIDAVQTLSLDEEDRS